jgi:hypothetical protein
LDFAERRAYLQDASEFACSPALDRKATIVASKKSVVEPLFEDKNLRLHLVLSVLYSAT